MGFANSPATRTALAGYGIRVSGYRWQWGLGLKGGTFPPHYHQNGEHAPTADSFTAQPGEDVNGESCMCALVPVYRDQAGRFARPGLEPVFSPPAVASWTRGVHPRSRVLSDDDEIAIALALLNL